MAVDLPKPPPGVRSHPRVEAAEARAAPCVARLTHGLPDAVPELRNDTFAGAHAAGPVNSGPQLPPAATRPAETAALHSGARGVAARATRKPSWTRELADVKQRYPTLDATSRARVLQARQAVFEEVGAVASRSREACSDAAATEQMVATLSQRWDAAFMRGGGAWKARVADAVAHGFAAGVQILGVSEWDQELDALVKARGLDVSSSSRLKNGKPSDGNGVIFDPAVFELVRAQKQVFATSAGSSEEKICHQATLRHRSSGDLVVAQAAHLEKQPDDVRRNSKRLSQMGELIAHAQRAHEATGGSVVLLADTNAEPLLAGEPNPLEALMANGYTRTYRPAEPTSVTGQRSVRIDVVAALTATSAPSASGTARAAATRAALGPLAQPDGMLPNAQNPSDHTWVVDAVPTGFGDVIAATWNVLGGSYRDPLKGNLFLPWVVLFNDENPDEREMLGGLLKTWGRFYEAAKQIPGWQTDGAPDERLYLGEYLAGPILPHLDAVRTVLNGLVDGWSDADRSGYAAALAQDPALYASAPNRAGEMLYMITHRRGDVLTALQARAGRQHL